MAHHHYPDAKRLVIVRAVLSARQAGMVAVGNDFEKLGVLLCLTIGRIRVTQWTLRRWRPHLVAPAKRPCVGAKSLNVKAISPWSGKGDVLWLSLCNLKSGTLKP
jgi:hypothetical protein